MSIRRAMTGAPPEEARDITYEVKKLRRINEVLMHRVERSMDLQGSEFSLFERAILLEEKVRERTAALEHALAELQETNRALADAKAEAEMANLSKTRFLAAASHDLLQPLNAARLFVSALSETDLSVKSRRLVENIDIAFESVERLLGALLDISKLDAGVVTPQIEDVPLAPLIRSLVAEFTPIAEQKELSLKSVPTSAVVRSDRTMLSRVIRNFIANALRYTREGGVLVGVRRDGDCFRIDVVDSGVGIPPDKREEIFEEFRRLGTDNNQRDRGFGLGLAIVKRIARMLEHELVVDSHVGRGSRFSILVPVSHARPRIHRERTRAMEKLPTAPGALVLVIENEEAIQEGMRALLQNWGYRVVTASLAGPAIGLMRHRNQHPDLVIADYHLDDALGTDAIVEVRRAFGPVPGLVITADRMPEAQRAIAALEVPLLNKPVRPAQLRAVLRHLLDSHCHA